MSSNGNTPQPPPQPQVVRVGVGVLVKDPVQPSKIICGIRKGSHGSGLVALPGGHLELYETWETCAQREVLEECDLHLDQSTIQFAHVTNDPMPMEGKHYVTIFIMGECCDSSSSLTSSSSSSSPHQPQQPKTMEPDKCEGWNSYSWEELTDLEVNGRLFGPLQRLVNDRPPRVLEFLKS
jgi:8-oxo-dGTP diphosphatase